MRIQEIAKSKIALAALAGGALGVLVILYAWQLPPFTSAIQTTNNAYVRGQVTLMSPQLAGYVTAVPVKDYMQVKKGDLLVQIDDRMYQQQLAQAEATLAQQQAALDNFALNQAAKQASLDLANAQLESAKAALEKAQLDDKRTGSLVDRGISTQASGDQTRVALLQAQSGVSQAQASVEIATQNLALNAAGKSSLEAAVRSAQSAVELANINLGNTRIVAPADGRLGEVAARVGQYVSAGTLLTSVTPPVSWVIANFKETQMPGMTSGQPVRFKVDAIPGVKFEGHITRISPAAGSEFSVLKADNATGNFTKVPQRVSVRIEVDNGPKEKLRPGMSVEVTVDTSAAPLANVATAD